MKRIRLYDHPFASEPPKVFVADSIGEWLLSHFGDAPSVTVQVFTGDPSAESEITGNIAAIMANDAEEYTVLQSPGEPISLTAFLTNLAIAAALSVISMLLAPTPSMPGNVNRTQQSPNNSLANRENQVRMLERVEDIYGTVLSIPSLMMPTYYKYINHRQYEYGYYCVGRGYYDLDELRDGDTLLLDIDGAAAAAYDPFTSPNNGSPVLQIGEPIIDTIATVSRAVEVDGITLKAQNQVQFPASATYTFSGSEITQETGAVPNAASIASAGQEIDLSMEPVGIVASIDTGSVTANSSARTFTATEADLFARFLVGDIVTITGFNNGATNNDGEFTIVEIISPESFRVAEPVNSMTHTSGAFSVLRDYSGIYEIEAVNDGSLVINADFHEEFTSTASVQIVGVSHITDWVTLRDAERAEVWSNIVAVAGMYSDSGDGKQTVFVGFTFEFEKLDPDTLAPTGVVESVSGSLSGRTQDERADTIEHVTSWAGPVRVRAWRTTPYSYGFQGAIIDEIKWGDLYAVTPVTRPEFGNKTTIHTVTRATSRSTAARNRQLNVLASRKLPTYNGETFSGAFDADGRHVSGTIQATSRIADIIAAVSADPLIGARDLATEVDMPQIYAVQQQLDAWDAACGQFNYTLDSDNISFEETVIMIASAAFCTAYRQNGKIRLMFERRTDASAALFTHRNKKPDAETLTRVFANDGEYDGVEFTYMDPDSNQAETITLPLDGNYLKAKKFEFPGIRSFTQAWYRANREYQKLVGQRLNIETVTTLDARSLLPNSRISIVDNTRFKSFDGEVIGQDGMEITLSQDVEFTPGLSHSIILMRRDGSLQSIACTLGSASNRVVLQSLPTEAVVTQYGQDGIRTIFSFAADTDRGAQAFLVQELDLSDGQYATIRAINYSDDYYYHDSQPVPAKDAIIN